MKTNSLWIRGLCLGLLAVPLPAAADGIVGARVHGNTLEANIRFSGGVGADLTVAFEQVVGLSPENLGLSASLLDAADLLDLQPRLDELVSVPAGFPVLVTLEPPESGGLSFSGVVSIELYTHDLVYVPGSPLRLFAAPLGGAFYDVTETTAGGSYRVRGTKGDFSEFLIVTDLRAVDPVIVEKFTNLDAELTRQGSSIPPSVYSELVTLLSEAEAAYRSDDLVTAIAKVEAFADTVETSSGSDIPDVWRSTRDLTNVGGRLRAGAATLRYSLILKANGAS